ncbi:MAG: hypothetical protein WB562_02280 [Candidatus Sulfotelmatobacter sp.]
MFQFQRARISGLLAAVSCLALLAGCGTSTGGGRRQIQTPTGPYDTPQNVAAYQQAISGYLAASSQNKAQALLFPVLTPSNQNFNDFMNNILPNISGVSVSLPWNQIESSDSLGTGSGGYDFSSYDANLQPFLAAGKQVNLIVWPATEGGDNTSTPQYVFTSAWANAVGATTPLDMTVCPSYTGDPANPDYNSALSGNGGIWNTSQNPDTSGLPVSYEAPFMVAYQHFIAAVIAHYNLPGSPQIGYIRFGFSQGGENSPECNQYWPGYSEAVYLAYVKSMTDFVRTQNPSMTILADLHAVGSPGSVDFAYSDTEAADAVLDGFGFGTNGLQQSDVTDAAVNLPCDADWCHLFSLYPGRTLSLQTLQWSDPTGHTQTGSLATLSGGTEGLIPFAQAHGANNLELYLADVALAYSSNYCNYPHAVCGP